LRLGSSWIDHLNSRAGIDGGGVFKEFLTSLAKEVFNSDRGLWLSTTQHELYPNPHTYATDGMVGNHISVVRALTGHC
jgi:hypothetical protein